MTEITSGHYPACGPDCGPEGHALQQATCTECGGPVAPVTRAGEFIRLACVTAPHHATRG